MPRAAVLVLAATCLPAGFAIAEATGVRALGGLALAGLAAGAVLVARPPALRAAGWLAVVVLAFALSHAVARALTAWVAVAVAAAVALAFAGLLLRQAE